MASPNPDLLQPPRRIPNPDHVVPLTPHTRPPFSHYHSSSTLPPTPHTPYSPRAATSQNGESDTRLRPYLSLSPRIILTFFSPCLLPIILTIAHMIQNRSSTASLANSLKQSMLSACIGLAKGAASIQTMPRYLAMQTNDEVIRATQASILAIGSTLMDAVTIIEVVVNFIIDTYRSMLLCTIELAVRGTLEIVIGAVDVITDAVTESLNSIRNEIQSDISAANRLIQSAVSGINSVTSLVNVNLSVPEFTIPSLDFLANVTIPTTFEDSLIKLNTSLPTLGELKQKMNAIIDVPFEALIKEINETRIEIASSFNSSLLPVPSLSSLSANKANDLQTDLCTNLDTSLIDDTAKALHRLSNIAIGLMFLLLFCIWAALVIWEWRKWGVMKNTVEAVEDEWRRENNVDAWRMVAIVENPMLEKYSSNILERMAPSNRMRRNLRWFLSYLAHPTCLALLFVSILGFLCIQFQLVALDALKAHARENANSTVAASTNSLTTKLNAAAMQSSQEYADQYNAAIAAYQRRIDDELFGAWLNTTAITLNSTLVEFYDGVEQVLNATFGGTILFNPINNFMYCILGSKIDNLEKGLTWISEHAHIDLPTLPSDILMLSPESMNEIATPIASAAVGSNATPDGDDQGVVGSLITHFENALKAERTFYGIMLAMWVLLFLIGIIIVIWNSGGRDRYYTLRGRSVPSSSNNNQSFTGVAKWIPWSRNNNDVHPIYDTYSEKQFRGTTPTDPNLPRIIEPTRTHTQNKGEGEKSFFEYPNSNSDSRRPFVSRKGTFGSTLSSLVAPGQAFLKLAGRKVSSSNTNNQRQCEDYDNDTHNEVLLERGTSSEKYNSGFHQDGQQLQQGERSGTPQPFWVDRFYGAVEGVKSIFPTTGQKHGAAIASVGLVRNDSSKTQVTEKSFGASQMQLPTSQSIKQDWPIHSDTSSPPAIKGAEWTMVDPQSIGRALDTDYIDNDNGRYPKSQIHNYDYNYTDQAIFPRRMSRAPTISEGSTLRPTTNPFSDNARPPPLPSKLITDQKHDSIDCLQSSEDDYGNREDRFVSVTSPTSSSRSYFAAEPIVKSVSKVKVGDSSFEGRGTTALAGILNGLQEKRKKQVNMRKDVDPFGDSRRIA
ncbi:uncharacterized protein IL334_006234 [Kwoniella shivajii]|uniref:Plasma membrane fusion protein PRM1 n=1 Tax=Kwoniella shivajii TaxID=564305 RepID=A0ABZ1D5C7_9TREE|nr:hypothetical protein IL334_006234 [Kwoniella shivajii]